MDYWIHEFECAVEMGQLDNGLYFTCVNMGLESHMGRNLILSFEASKLDVS